MLTYAHQLRLSQNLRLLGKVGIEIDIERVVSSAACGGAIPEPDGDHDFDAITASQGAAM